MFDEYNNNQKVDIKPACVGLLQKSHPKSFFIYCHINSNYQRNYVDNNPRVLQVMVFGDGHTLVEILPSDVYEEWINARKEE